MRPDTKSALFEKCQIDHRTKSLTASPTTTLLVGLMHTKWSDRWWEACRWISHFEPFHGRDVTETLRGCFVVGTTPWQLVRDWFSFLFFFFFWGRNSAGFVHSECKAETGSQQVHGQWNKNCDEKIRRFSSLTFIIYCAMKKSVYVIHILYRWFL